MRSSFSFLLYYWWNILLRLCFKT